MVRAGVAEHPSEWPFSGYNEIPEPRRKCKIVAYDLLRDLLGFETYNQLRAAHRSWVHEALKDGNGDRDAKWSESHAVGSEGFVERTRERLGIRAKGREVRGMDGQFELREPEAIYHSHFEAKKTDIEPENSYLWNDYS